MAYGGNRMAPGESSQHNTLFATDQDCISYLFQKRWPNGFRCPFCNRLQSEISPAHTIVCRYCRKQSSITANTLMHGSKKSLTEWVQVAAQFCFSKEGVSARSLQNSFHIATYQTAWNWLKKLRKAAAIAESAPLTGPVLLFVTTTGDADSPLRYISNIACLMEVADLPKQPTRVRLVSLLGTPQNPLPHIVKYSIPTSATIITSESIALSLADIRLDYHIQTTDSENQKAIELLQELQQWMSRIYRGATGATYLQGYLDEFCFRHNTATWNNRLAILDHLLTGIMSGHAIPQDKTTLDK
ncbi:MAG: hypothetical protein COA36_14210 [Desulfotalea sp.]|nr:MAG: hypothetical protein COA36_14210 [Desulfotalea sp.]